MAEYEQGQLHTAKDGTTYRLQGDEWVPTTAEKPWVSDTNKALSSVGLLAEGIAGLPQDIVRTGATLSAGASDLLSGQLPNWTAARERMAPENNAVVDAFGYPKRAVKGAVEALGGDTGTSYLAEAGKAILDPLAQAVGPLSDASKTSLDVLGVGGAFLGVGPTARAASQVAEVIPGMSGMASRVVGQADTFAKKVAPRYTGVNQEIEAGLSAISQQAAKTVGLGDGVPLTAKGLAVARETTKQGYDDVFNQIDEAGGFDIPVAGLVNDIKANMADTGAISPIAAKAVDKSIADFIPTNVESLTVQELYRLQSAIGKQANDLRAAGKNVKADALDTVHTSVMDNFTKMLDTNYPTLTPKVTNLRNQYHAQAILGRAGVIGSEGNLNIPSLYRATQKLSRNTDDLVKLGEMAKTMKDMGGVKTGLGVVDQLMGKGIAGGIGLAAGGIGGAIAGAILEPTLARASSWAYQGLSGMASRMRQLDAVQPSNTWLSPNAGKFGQGGGIGISATRQAALAARAQRAEAANRTVGRPANAPRPEDLGVPPALNRMTKPQQAYAADWIDRNPKTAMDIASGPVGYKEIPQSKMVPMDQVEQSLSTQGLLGSPATRVPREAVMGDSTPALAMPSREGVTLEQARAAMPDVKHLSTWDQAQVAEQVKAADKMLRKLNPKDIASKRNNEGYTPPTKEQLKALKKQADKLLTETTK